MQKIISLLILVLLILTSFTGCATDKKLEEELGTENIVATEEKLSKTEQTGKMEDEETKLKDNKGEATKNDEPQKEAVEGKVIAKEDLRSLDYDLLYFMDQDIDFLTMKGMGLPAKNQEYFVDTLGYDFEIRFYLAEDEYTVKRITMIGNPHTIGGSMTEDENDDYETPSFMGLYLGMPLDLAKEYVQTEVPDYDGELEVKYFDKDGDGIVHQIDVISQRDLVKRIAREDFYFKFFDLNIHNEADHLGNGSGAEETLDVDEANRTYTYNITFGTDEYQKVYTYKEDSTIKSMEIKSDKDKFLAVVPSLFGIQLSCEKDQIKKLVEAEDKTIHSSKPAKITDSKYDVEEYTIIDNPSKIVYTALVYTDKVNHKVKEVKGYFKEKRQVNLTELSKLIGTELEGNNRKTEGTGTEKWVVDYEAYGDNIIKSIAIYGMDDGIFINTVPSLCGLQLHMFAMGVNNTLVNNGYEIIKEKHYSPYEDESLEAVKYTVVNKETNKESNIYITSQYIGDISAAIVVRIAIS